jgi:hypothetical protein
MSMAETINEQKITVNGSVVSNASHVTGWCFAGWTPVASYGGTYEDQATWEARFVTGSGTITASSGYPYANNGQNLVLMSDTTGDGNPDSYVVTLGAENMKLYAVWYKDANNNGKPDWFESADYQIHYSGSYGDLKNNGGDLDPDTMPFHDHPDTSSVAQNEVGSTADPEKHG